MDAYFAGGWSRELDDDAYNVMSSTIMIFMYDKFPVYWNSSLQTETAIITPEAEYTALSSALR